MSNWLTIPDIIKITDFLSNKHWWIDLIQQIEHVIHITKNITEKQVSLLIDNSQLTPNWKIITNNHIQQILYKRISINNIENNNSKFITNNKKTKYPPVKGKVFL